MNSSDVALLLAATLTLATLAAWLVGLLSRTPLLIHNAVWVVALAVTGSGLLHYVPNSGRAWLVIGAGILAFNVGAMIPAVVHPGGQAGKAMPIRAILTRRRFYILLAAYSVGFVYYLYGLAGRYGLSTLVRNPSSIRAITAGETYLEAVPLPIKLLYYLGPFIFVIVSNPWTVVPVLRLDTRILAFGYMLVSQAALLQRTNLFVAVFWQVGLLVIEPPAVRSWRKDFRRRTRVETSRRARGRRITLVIGCGVLALVAFQVIASRLGTTNQNESVTLNIDPRLENSPWTSALVYISSGIPGFGQLVESTNPAAPPSVRTGEVLIGDYNPQTWGRALFSSPLKVIPIAEPWQPIAPFTRVPFLTNVYTWFEPYYRDFRAPGVLGMSFVSGVILTCVHRRRTRDGRWLLVASLTVGLTAWAPFVNPYGTVLVIESVAVALLLGSRSTARHPVGSVPVGDGLDPEVAEDAEPVPR